MILVVSTIGKPLAFFVERICSIAYRYDQYGCDQKGGYCYYENHVRSFIRASQTCFVERSCYENWCALG